MRLPIVKQINRQRQCLWSHILQYQIINTRSLNRDANNRIYGRGAQTFRKSINILKILGVGKHVRCWGPTDIRLHRTKRNRHGDLATGVFASLVCGSGKGRYVHEKWSYTSTPSICRPGQIYPFYGINIIEQNLSALVYGAASRLFETTY
jgi:hypothetical protein